MFWYIFVAPLKRRCAAVFMRGTFATLRPFRCFVCCCVPWGALGVTLGVLWVTVGHFGVHFGVLWVTVGHFGGPRGPLWGYFGVSGAPLGGLWGHFGVLGATLGRFGVPRSTRRSERNQAKRGSLGETGRSVRSLSACLSLSIALCLSVCLCLDTGPILLAFLGLILDSCRQRWARFGQ